MKAPIHFEDGLLFVSAMLEHQGRQISLSHVLLGTGSEGCVFSSEGLANAGIRLEPGDGVRQIRGVGGVEIVASKRIETLCVGNMQVENIEVELSAMEYGFQTEVIIGADFLVQVGAIIDLARLEIRTARKTKRME